MSKLPNHNKGFTLIELLIALALVTLVTSLTFSYYSFQSKTFEVTNTQTQLQTATRFAREIIETKVKYAQSIEILSEIPQQEDLSDDQEAIFVDANGIIVYLTKTASKNLLGNSFNDVDMCLCFYKATDAEVTDNLLGFNVKSVIDNDEYTLESQVYLINHPGINDAPIPDPDNSNAISFVP
ncbi:MAG: prepilin-type N-terminal cleavage/methylation domain-containing protein [Bacillota bacterium]|nr:prepilin-type N-terminal cleavage/methylation domain-containing protein [Bacillota bacterium]